MIRKISISLHGHSTSFSLEEEFLEALKEIATQRGLSFAGLVAEVDDLRRDGENLSSALRVFVLREVRRQ
jgi:predicted DNA-binding ribbon-helix-helix protein